MGIGPLTGHITVGYLWEYLGFDAVQLKKDSALGAHARGP